MPLQLRHASQRDQRTAGRWRWRVWMDGSSEQLDRIQSVRYQLPGSFPDPIRDVSERVSGFAIEDWAWKPFTIYAAIQFPDGSEEYLDHRVEPTEPAATPLYHAIGPKSRRPHVFLSYSAVDAPLARDIAAALRSAQVDVFDSASDIPAGQDWKLNVRDAIDTADLGVVLLSDSRSEWVKWEAQQLIDRGKPIVPVALGDRAVSTLPADFAKIRYLQVGLDDGGPAIAERIAASIRDLTKVAS